MNLRWPGQYRGPEELLDAAQNFTALWVDIGDLLDVRGAYSVALWLTLVVNNSTDIRVRMLCAHTDGGDEFTIPIRTVAAAVVTVEPEYDEFNVDEDRLMVLDWILDGAIGYVQFQIQVGAVGAPAAAQVLSAQVTTSGIG